MTTANMLLDLPRVLGTPGPQYAGQINSALQLIDQHDHTPGKGQPVPSAGIDINEPLPFNNHPATQLSLAQLQDQAVNPSPSVYQRSLFAKAGDLWFLNGSGVAVRVTNAGALNPSGVGGFGGDYTQSGAVAEYSSAQSRYSFRNPNASLADIYGQAGNFAGALAAAGALTVGGTSTLTGNVTATGSLSVGAGLGVTGAVTATGALSGTNGTLTGALAVTGNVTGAGTLNLTGLGASALGGTLTAANLVAQANVSASGVIETGVAAGHALRGPLLLARSNAVAPAHLWSRGSGTNPSPDWSFTQNASTNNLELDRANLAAAATVRFLAPIELVSASTVSAALVVATNVQQKWGTSTLDQTLITNGSIDALKFRSSNGVRFASLLMGHVYFSTGFTYVNYIPREPCRDGSTAGLTENVMTWPAEFDGSILAKTLQAQFQGVPGGQTAKMDLYKNGALLWTGTTFAANQQIEKATKGTYSFVTGDDISVRFTTTYSATGFWRFRMLVEMDVR